MFKQDILSRKINRVDEFYKNNSFGTNNKTIGKWNVKVKIRTFTPGSAWIRGTETPNVETRRNNQGRYRENIHKFWKILDEEQEDKK